MSASSPSERFGPVVAETREKFMTIAALDGNRVDFEREAMFALQIITKSDYLQKCNIETIQSAIINVATVGLTLNPAMKLAYLVPRKGVCCLDISYIGLVKLATDTGGVLAVDAVIVRRNDTFRYRGPFEMPEHDFDPFAPESERGDLRGVYAVAMLPSRITKVTTVSAEDIQKIRAKSEAKRDDAPWSQWFDEMVKKSAIKRGSKLWPRTERFAAAEAILNATDGFDEPIEGEFVREAVPQPTPKAAAPAPTGTPQEPSPRAPAEPQPKKANPLTDGAVATLQRRMKQQGRSETDLTAAGFPAIAAMTFEDHFAKAMEWLTKNPAKAA